MLLNTGWKKQIEALILDEQKRVEVEAKEVAQEQARQQLAADVAAWEHRVIYVQRRKRDGTMTPPRKYFCVRVESGRVIVRDRDNRIALTREPGLVVRNEVQRELGALSGKTKLCARLARESYQRAFAETQRVEAQVCELMTRLEHQREYLDGILKETFGQLSRAYGTAARLGHVPSREVRG